MAYPPEFGPFQHGRALSGGRFRVDHLPASLSPSLSHTHTRFPPTKPCTSTCRNMYCGTPPVSWEVFVDDAHLKPAA